MSENTNINHIEEAKKIAHLAILSFGLISLFGDIIYEGARGIIPTYLYYLGASATLVGLIVGLGEFIGYALRLISGYLADVKRTYWIFVFLGYGLLVVVPLLAFIVDWRLALVFILLERTAKALRSPARDTLLSVTTKGVGTGKAFGFHELMDQIGAVSGPAIVALVLLYTGSIRYSLMVLFIPYLMLISVLLIGYSRMKGYTDKALKEILEIKKKTEEKLSGTFYTYSFAVFLNTAGLFHVALILYLATEVFPPEQEYLIPIIFLVIQGVDAIMALIAGYTYDKAGIRVLIVPFVLSVVPTFFALQKTYISIWVAAIFFGLVLGMQESVYRAAVADLTGISKRGTGYGIFNTLYGLGFLTSGFIFGYFIDANLAYLALMFSIVAQIGAVILLLLSIGISKRKE